MDKIDITNEWYKFAEMDLATSQHLYKTMHPKPLEIICYHAQQCAEKMLKGYLISIGIEFPKTHNLPQLCEKCVEYDDDFKEIYEQCETLTAYGIQPRYPYEMEIEESECKDAILSAKTIVKFVRESTLELMQKEIYEGLIK